MALVIKNFNVGVATEIQRQGAWIKYVIHHLIVLANGGVRKKTYATQNIHVCKAELWKNIEVFLSIQNTLHCVLP